MLRQTSPYYKTDESICGLQYATQLKTCPSNPANQGATNADRTSYPSGVPNEFTPGL